MGVKILIDSVIVIDHLNKISIASAWLSKEHLRSMISVVTRAEVLAGYELHERPPIQRFLDAFTTLAIDSKIADIAGTLRREYKWRLPDAFQAAIARNHKLTLATRNTKDFPPDKFDWVLIPYLIDAPSPQSNT